MFDFSISLFMFFTIAMYVDFSHVSIQSLCMHAAPAAVRPRRETTGCGYGSALPKPKKASAVKKPAAREAAATSAATAIVEAARTAETTQVD